MNKSAVVLVHKTNQLLFTTSSGYPNGNIVHRFLPSETNYLNNSFYAFCLLNTLLQSFTIHQVQVESKTITLVFSQTKELKLKQLQKKWETIQIEQWKNSMQPVESFAIPDLQLQFTNKQITFAPQWTGHLPALHAVRLLNLSTFTKHKTLYHKLVATINVQQLVAAYDHRELNKNLKFFYFNKQIGSGLPFWLPNGVIVKNLIRDYLQTLEKAANFVFVESPLLGSEKIYQTSEHLKHYREFMFPMLQRQNEKLYLRPMSCPHHCLLYQAVPRSYLDLPLRLSENAYLFRQEASGALIGLERTRQMQLKDSHIFTTNDPKMIEQEITQCFQLTQTALQALGVRIKTIYLSTNDSQAPAKFIDAPQLWRYTTSILQTVLKKLQVNFQLMVGEAAFYGPKIDFQIDTVLGHNITVSTIQLDFSLPQKFQLKYRTASQKTTKYESPILIHHGLIGTYERLFMILMEQNAGWLPFWLAPVQIMILPISNELSVQNYVRKTQALFQKYQLRSQIAPSTKKLTENIKSSWLQKIPCRVFIGNKELATQKITFHIHLHSAKKQTQDVFAFIDLCLNLIRNKE